MCSVSVVLCARHSRVWEEGSGTPGFNLVFPYCSDVINMAKSGNPVIRVEVD